MLQTVKAEGFVSPKPTLWVQNTFLSPFSLPCPAALPVMEQEPLQALLQLFSAKGFQCQRHCLAPGDVQP